ncbi:stealth family protein [Pediococcus pentosaceus]|uniref:stealth family protein n=1 Tax=Pediococcus pentosaceus TaxID=1255 RepID=UPI000B4B2E3F|nr:stealth family protein [Pediococcus pentosaceus]ASC08776.1 UDP-N-acetylglucosamine--lysosomal-enzymeN-acetylglucosaminephosphotransferase [Pediococcus pentosaceus]WFC01389.1 stealth family protein [Pediococcus pentosaceus]
MIDKIDFVVTWVDNNDEAWMKKKQYYQTEDKNETLNTDSRYRDFDLLKYWFRSVEKYAPWVNRIFLVTDNQVPDWLDTTNEKIICVDHTDYIEQKFLPTFNSNVIELNVANIPELGENFVLFNDDTFLNDSIDETFFFKNELPVDTFIESPIMATKGSVAHTMVNNMELINTSFEKKEFYKKNWKKVFSPKIGLKVIRTIALLPGSDLSGIWNSHLPVPYKKNTFIKLWDIFGKKLIKTNENKFRTPYDYSHWLMRYWQLVSGKFVPKNTRSGMVYDLGTASISIIKDDILSGKHKVICLNDTDNLTNPDTVKKEVTETFNRKFPGKSSFEV